MARPTRVGVSACFFHADPERPVFKGKTLLYVEESMLQWLMARRALPVLLPRVGKTRAQPASALTYDDLLSDVDGLLLQGGSDVAPQSYGEEPLRPEWAGDASRDRYEIDLVNRAILSDKPVLGVCRGIQILNVALGGTLYQDIATQHPDHRTHRDWQVYDQLRHEVDIEPGSWLAARQLDSEVTVNSVHHQAIKDLAPSLEVEARSVPDGLVEAVRYRDSGVFAYGVQWHPEFQRASETELLSPFPVLEGFLEAIASRRQRR